MGADEGNGCLAILSLAETVWRVAAIGYGW